MPRRLFSPEAALFTPSFIAICCANLLFFIAGFMLVPVLPIYLLDDLHATKSTVGVILSTYMLGALIIAVLRNGFSLLSVSSAVQNLVLGLVIIGAVLLDVTRERMAAKARRLAAK